MADSQTQIDLRQVTLAVLAGGEGSRMGKAKGELRVGGKPILQYLLEGFAWPGATLVVTAPGRENPPAAALFDGEVCDPVALGPLGGVRTALQNAATEWVVVATVDMPGLRLGHLQWMVGQVCAHQNSMGLVLRRDVDGVGRLEPFPLVCSRALLARVENLLAGGKRSMRELAGVASVIVQDAPAEWTARVWVNLNSPAEFEAFVGGKE